MTFTASCLHCNRLVLFKVAQISREEVGTLQHHLLSRCRPDEASERLHHLGDILRHFQLTTEEVDRKL